MSTGSMALLRRLFLKNKRLKLLSLVLATLAWYAISSTVGIHGSAQSISSGDLVAATRKIAGVPVLAVVWPDPAVSVELLPARVNIVLTGRNSELQKLNRVDIRAMVDCGVVQAYTNCELPVVVNLPPGIDVATTVRPAHVKVILRPAR